MKEKAKKVIMTFTIKIIEAGKFHVIILKISRIRGNYFDENKENPKLLVRR